MKLEGVEQETVGIALSVGVEAFERLRSGEVQCRSVWLTEQPDGTFALGLLLAEPPEAQGLRARKVERDDRPKRFGYGVHQSPRPGPRPSAPPPKPADARQGVSPPSILDLVLASLLARSDALARLRAALERLDGGA